MLNLLHGNHRNPSKPFFGESENLSTNGKGGQLGSSIGGFRFEVQPLSLVLDEIHRVLEDKGIFVCIELEKSEMSKAPRVSSEEMEEEIVKAGFSVIDTFHSPTQIANQPVYIIIAQKNK
ncbi:hypothetical protein [Paenibacillus sp. OK003]|uniref:hypothetical protein n=1 Tax=Paenibacillus sp. OK003 TaxID=1884380 RepID=UPI0008D6E975|nr:hypothetical protein [Paenibacillus sp. OK003]SEK60816.1 hypothetical protein SAMN05518856_103185 [Paenibacillus sp. OK003]